MYRDNLELRSADQVNFVFNHGALGDVICSLPAVIHARLTHHASLKMVVWTPSYQLDLVSTLLHAYGDFEYRRFEDFQHKASERNPEEEGPVVINSIFKEQFTRNRVSLVDYAFVPLLDKLPENDAERSYPHEAPLGKRTISGPYIVFPVGATSENKMFRAKVMQPVLEWALDHDYKPVILGKSTTELHALSQGVLHKLTILSEYDGVDEKVRAACMDMRDKTTLVEARNICGYAAAVVGVDGGTIHLAATTEVPIVYGLTTTRPEHRAIVRHGINNWRTKHVTPRDLACAGCQSNWTLLFGQDFRFCAYKDNLCTEKLHPQDFIDAIESLTRGQHGAY